MATGAALSVIHGPAADRLRRRATYASVAVAAVADRGQIRGLARNRVGRAVVEPDRLAARRRCVDRQSDRGAACADPGRSRASLWPRQGGTAGRARPVGLHHRQRAVAARRGGAPADPAGRGRQPAGRHRGHGLFDRGDGRAGALSAACRAPHRVDRDQRRRTALSQRSDFERQRHRRAGPQRHFRPAHPRSAVRRSDRHLDHLFGGTAGAAVAGPADGPRVARRRARKDPRNRPVASRGGRRARSAHPGRRARRPSSRSISKWTAR